MSATVVSNSAFPHPYMRGPGDEPGQGIQQAEGMTLRDYFAAKAMLGILSSPRGPVGHDDMVNGVLANDAYSVADSMLAERAK